MTVVEEAPPTSRPAGQARVTRLREAVAGMSLRGNRKIDLQNVLFLAGAVLVPLGLLVVVLGWVGASRTPYLFEQIPYLISGGLLGVGLLVVGSFAYFAHWLTRLYHQQREQADRTLEILERLEARLAEVEQQANGNGTPRRARASTKK